MTYKQMGEATKASVGKFNLYCVSERDKFLRKEFPDIFLMKNPLWNNDKQIILLFPEFYLDIETFKDIKDEVINVFLDKGNAEKFFSNLRNHIFYNLTKNRYTYTKRRESKNKEVSKKIRTIKFERSYVYIEYLKKSLNKILNFKGIYTYFFNSEKLNLDFSNLNIYNFIFDNLRGNSTYQNLNIHERGLSIFAPTVFLQHTNQYQNIEVPIVSSLLNSTQDINENIELTLLMSEHAFKFIKPNLEKFNIIYINDGQIKKIKENYKKVKIYYEADLSLKEFATTNSKESTFYQNKIPVPGFQFLTSFPIYKSSMEIVERESPSSNSEILNKLFKVTYLYEGNYDTKFRHQELQEMRKNIAKRKLIKLDLACLPHSWILFSQSFQECLEKSIINPEQISDDLLIQLQKRTNNFEENIITPGSALIYRKTNKFYIFYVGEIPEDDIILIPNDRIIVIQPNPAKELLQNIDISKEEFLENLKNLIYYIVFFLSPLSGNRLKSGYINVEKSKKLITGTIHLLYKRIFGQEINISLKDIFLLTKKLKGLTSYEAAKLLNELYSKMGGKNGNLTVPINKSRKTRKRVI